MEYRAMWPDGAKPSALGYGCMRFPIDKTTGKIDEEQAQGLVRRAMEAGVTYYDTAWAYHDGDSEAFMGRALSHFPRESYYLTTKLPCWLADSREKAEEIINCQLQRLNTTYLDFYMLHSLNRKNWNKMLELGILDLLEEYRRQGKLRRLGFSFHDSCELFEEILRYRKWDVCQIQLNYMDANYQAGLKGLALAQSMGVPVVVMEPVKGGSLAQLSDEVAQPLRNLNQQATPASWAMRWVASQNGVAVILSGMTTQEQLDDNVKTFSPLRPLDQRELEAVEQAANLLRQRLKNGCTGCRYCMPCPVGVDIPASFQLWNNMSVYQNRSVTKRAWGMMAPEARPDQCVKCGQCERQCPQNIHIREHLAAITGQVEEFLG